MGEHDGRVALVTGASRGIGRAAALALGRQGSAVAVHGKEDRETRDVADLITASGGKAICLVGPIEEAATTERAVAETVAEFGGLDTLVTSAGIQRYGDVASTPPSRWHELFAVNVTGVYLACHFAMPYLRESSAGSVVIVSSAQATATQAQVVGYTATKGARVSMARAMAVDEGLYGVRVNSVSPGSVDTPMLRTAAAELSDGTDEAPTKRSSSGVPLMRLGESQKPTRSVK